MKFQDTTLRCFIRNIAWKKDLHRIYIIELISSLFYLHQNKSKKKSKYFFSFICVNENVDQQGPVLCRASTYLIDCYTDLPR